jgi:hypothetical protein
MDINHNSGMDHTAIISQKSQLFQSKYEPTLAILVMLIA